MPGAPGIDPDIFFDDDGKVLYIHKTDLYTICIIIIIVLEATIPKMSSGDKASLHVFLFLTKPLILGIGASKVLPKDLRPTQYRKNTKHKMIKQQHKFDNNK